MEKLKETLKRLLLYPLAWRYVSMPGSSYEGPLPALDAEGAEIARNAEKHVRALADDVGERHLKKPEALEAAAKYIRGAFTALGYTTVDHEFTSGGVRMRNVVAELAGSGEGVLVLGAHYDSVFNCPGADDNGTGIAALLELARMLRASRPLKTIRFVAFANEENPGLPWESMGSYAYATECAQRGDKIVGMLSLEMLGYYSDAPGSQKYPSPFNLFYPSVGNFIGFVGNWESRKFVRRCVRTFRRSVKFPSEGVAAPTRFRDVNRSDHWSFWQFGYPALMVTDTSNFRYPFVHTPEDTPDKIDFDKMARVVHGILAVVRDLSR